jgi:hypothetical protein
MARTLFGWVGEPGGGLTEDEKVQPFCGPWNAHLLAALSERASTQAPHLLSHVTHGPAGCCLLHHKELRRGGNLTLAGHLTPALPPRLQVALASAGSGDVDALHSAYVRSGGPAPAQSSSHTGLIVLLVCAGLLVAAGGAFAWFRLARPRLLGAPRGEYVPMASLEEGADYRPPHGQGN